MVKGISRQVIVVQSPEPELFDQAIFILKENVGEGISDDALLKEAKKAIQSGGVSAGKRQLWLSCAVWAAGGSAVTGLVWLLTALI